MGRTAQGSRRWPYVIAALLALAVVWIGYQGIQDKAAKQAANGPTFHDQIKDLPEAQRFEKLRYVITDQQFCDRIIRAEGFEPPTGGAIWSVSCYDGHQYGVLVGTDARKAPTAVPCDALKQATTYECWSR